MDTKSVENAGSPRESVFSELQAVHLKRPLSYDGIDYPAQTRGVIVWIHNGGEAFEVELFEPASAVVAVYPDQFEPAS